MVEFDQYGKLIICLSNPDTLEFVNNSFGEEVRTTSSFVEYLENLFQYDDAIVDKSIYEYVTNLKDFKLKHSSQIRLPNRINELTKILENSRVELFPGEIINLSFQACPNANLTFYKLQNTEKKICEGLNIVYGREELKESIEDIIRDKINRRSQKLKDQLSQSM